MDKTPVDTQTLEEQLLSDLRTAVSEESKTSRPLDCEDIDRIIDRAEKLVADFRAKFEEECFEAWRIAQAFKIDEDYNRYLDERRILTEQQEGFRHVVAAYNREREKEGKTDHKFTGLPEEPKCPEGEHHHERPDNCIHHDDDDTK